jgi:hypothetical protein
MRLKTECIFQSLVPNLATNEFSFDVRAEILRSHEIERERKGRGDEGLQSFLRL